MRLLVWCIVRLAGHRTVRPGIAWSAILFTAAVFGITHLSVDLVLHVLPALAP